VANIGRELHLGRFLGFFGDFWSIWDFLGLLEQANHQVTKGLSGVSSAFGLERLARKKSDGGRDPKILNWLLSCDLGDQLLLVSVEIMMALFFCLSWAIMSETITIVTPIFESVFASLETLVTHIMGCDDRPFETGVVWSQ